MISFDLCCAHHHVFEVWFRSSGDYEDQRARGLISCPVCNNASVTKAVMAPNISGKGNRGAGNREPDNRGPVGNDDARSLPIAAASATPRSSPAGPSTLAEFAATAAAKLPPEALAALATVARIQAEMLPKSTWVGTRFAAQARAQAASDDPAAQPLIHGQATRAEAEALIDDGIAIMPLLVPIVPPDLQN